jgi:hypothetical protein
MTVHEISQVYGFTIKNPELLKLILAKLAENPKWAGDYETMEPEMGGDNEKENEWTHNGLLYQFHEFPHFFRQGPKTTAGQDKARELFPELPEGVRMFNNTFDHNNSWHLGIEISYMETGWAKMHNKNPIDPVKLVADHSAVLTQLKSRYDHLLKEDTPVIFEVTDDCACCS